MVLDIANEDRQSVGEVDMRDVEDKLNSVTRYTSLEDDPMRRRILAFVAQRDGNSLSDITRVSRQAVANRVREYKAVANAVGQANESYNANIYIDAMLEDELIRVGHLSSKAQREVYKHQTEFLTLDFQSKFYEFLKRVMLVTIVASSLLSIFLAAMLNGALHLTAFTVVAGILLLIYAIILTMMFSNNTMRKRYHWSKYYWQTSGKHDPLNDSEMR